MTPFVLLKICITGLVIAILGLFVALLADYDDDPLAIVGGCFITAGIVVAAVSGVAAIWLTQI